MTTIHTPTITHLALHHLSSILYTESIPPQPPALHPTQVYPIPHLTYPPALTTPPPPPRAQYLPPPPSLPIYPFLYIRNTTDVISTGYPQQYYTNPYHSLYSAIYGCPSQYY